MATTMTETAAQREDRMLHQSFLKETEVKPIGGGRYAMHSATTPAGMAYLTTTETCSCEWFQRRGTVCSHIARVRFEESFRPAVAAVCPTCQGREVVAVKADNGKWMLDHCPDCAGIERYG